jgi:hypothetical protein
MRLELTDQQTEVLIQALSQIIENDRYPLSPRIVALKEILRQLRPEPERPPLPPRRHYEPPSKERYGRRLGDELMVELNKVVNDVVDGRL